MTDEEIRSDALGYSLDYYRDCRSDEGHVSVPRQQVIETAARFAEYIKDGT